MTIVSRQESMPLSSSSPPPPHHHTTTLTGPQDRPIAGHHHHQSAHRTARYMTSNSSGTTADRRASPRPSIIGTPAWAPAAGASAAEARSTGIASPPRPSRRCTAGTWPAPPRTGAACRASWPDSGRKFHGTPSFHTPHATAACVAVLDCLQYMMPVARQAPDRT